MSGRLASGRSLVLLGLVLCLCLLPACHLFRATPTYSEDESFGPERFPDLGLLVEDLSRARDDAPRESVKQEFEAVLLGKGYSLTPHGRDLDRMMGEHERQLSDLTAGQVVELGKLANAKGLVVASILEFRTDAVTEPEEDDRGRPRPVTRWFTLAKLEGAFFDVETGRKLWTAKFEARAENTGRDRTPQPAVLDRVAHEVANTCSPRPWWWFVCH